MKIRRVGAQAIAGVMGLFWLVVIVIAVIVGAFEVPADERVRRWDGQ